VVEAAEFVYNAERLIAEELMQKVIRILRSWLPLACVITAMCGLVYISEQQSLRQNANDPQIQIAEDAADALARGATVESVMPANKIDVAKSLAPFVIVYDAAGKPIASSGLLRDQIPALPSGVFDYVRQHGEDRLTWQPDNGVRIAAVVIDYKGAKPGFVLAGRSLREVEKRVDLMGMYAVAAWIATLGATLGLIGLGEVFLTEKK
jgi:hypothetical protein